jgi:glutamine amidotransferase
VDIAIIKYNAGNIQSLSNALGRLGASFEVTDDPEVLRTAPRVIFPGVGEASSAMQYLATRRLDKVITGLRQPVLGVCLGLQLLCERSEENSTECLSITQVVVRRFTLPRKIPHMGWSRVKVGSHPLFDGIEDNAYFYFVHSYRADICPYTIASCTYEEPFSAALAVRNFVGVQFHPEKSGASGHRLLANFLRWNP